MDAALKLFAVPWYDSCMNIRRGVTTQVPRHYLPRDAGSVEPASLFEEQGR